MLRRRLPGELVAVTLDFVEPVNIGEMATGPVKAVSTACGRYSVAGQSPRMMDAS